MATNEGTEDEEPPLGTDRFDEFLDWLLSGTSRVAFATDECGRLTWWNDRLPAATGCDRERLDGLDATELFATDPTEVRDRLCGVIEGTRRVALSVETADGRAVPHEFDGTVCSGLRDGAYLYVGRPNGGRTTPGGDVDASGVETRAGVRPDDPSRYRRIVETVRDGVFTLDGGWNVVEANRPLASMLGHDREKLLGTHATELIASDGSVERAREVWTALQRGEVESGTVQLTILRADGERFPAAVSYGAFPLPDGEVGAVGVVRDVTEREAREARLREARDRLTRLNRIGDAAAAALDPVIDAGSRDEVERRVCERLADSDLYDVVWIGRPEGGDRLVPRTTAGADATFHEVAERLAERTDHERSATRAFRRGESVVNREGWEAEAGEVVCEATGGRELRATMAIPLEYRGTTYGALTAYSTREDAFFEAEQEALERLGRAVGFAISAVGTRRLVHAHERAELEFRVGPESSVLAAVSAAVDAECALRLTTPATGSGDHERAEPSRPEGSLHDLWLRVAVGGSEVDADAVLEAVEGAGVVEARVVEAGTDGCTVDLRAPESVPGYVVAAGARPREVVADDGRARVVAEVPAGADIRSVVEAFTDATGAELVAKRRPGDAQGDSLSASLTDKQREALRTAEAMGYFDWPREHTAEEVADRLGVASATLHYHLRAAQRTLVDAALDATDDG